MNNQTEKDIKRISELIAFHGSYEMAKEDIENGVILDDTTKVERAKECINDTKKSKVTTYEKKLRILVGLKN
ncbi:hypothetical protein [Flammeovirga pacifica]|uniref:Uncharacterized protein n=1 Tax=Flammeovirga pacifica TaxID=915059 RepID=A0A1S1Z0E0_FLAPC|nr:hypothetical protein [Flammeovirga pacifica]OHX66726.1 hypothetical protein NH26_10335 [Flammeovirga pacifica]